MANDDLAQYLIRKHGAWYRPNCRGYTSSAIQAGRYTLAEAERYTHPNGKNGPRDSMDYVHEDDVADPDWLAYRELIAALATMQAREAELVGEVARWREQCQREGKQYFIVWNDGRSEGFVTDDEADAAACLWGGSRSGSTAGIAFAEAYEDDERILENHVLPATAIKATDNG